MKFCDPRKKDDESSDLVLQCTIILSIYFSLHGIFERKKLKTKNLKLKVSKFLGFIPTFVGVTVGNLVGGSFLPFPPVIVFY